MSPYEIDACATIFADALRGAGLATRVAGPVRLLPPQWRNETDVDVGQVDVFIRALVKRINERSGAAVAFEPDRPTGSLVWHGDQALLLPTTLTLEKTDSRKRVDLVFRVMDRERKHRKVEARHRISLSPGKSEKTEPPKTRARVRPEERVRPKERARPEERVRPEERARPEERVPEDRPPTRERPNRTARKVRECRLPNAWAMPDDEDVEREVELDCGRLLFLHRKTAKRVVLVTNHCRRSETKTLTVELELVCTRKKREIEIWAEFFDAQGKGVHRTRRREHTLREGQIRTITFESLVPADRVVILIEKD